MKEDLRVIKTKDNIAFIQGSYYNDFIALQRLLSFGADCIVVSPSEIKEELIKKLKSMREQYD